VRTADGPISELTGRLISFMETGKLPDGTFTADLFCDFTMPRWRLQAKGSDNVVALRLAGHPGPGRVPRTRLDATETGFVIEVEVCELSVYCTGDWDADLVARHAKTVHLIRP
jgi:hypothetical protein